MTTLVFLVLFIFTIQNVHCLEEHRVCVRSSSKVGHVTGEISDEAEEMQEGSSEGATFSTNSETGVQYVQCASHTHHCYAVWKEDGNDSYVIMGQGCWEISGKPQDCERNQCVSDKKPPKAMNNTKFCCCSGDYCNVNFTDIYVPSTDEPRGPPPATEYLEQARQERQTMIVWSAAVCSLLFALAVTALVYHVWRARGLSTAKSAPDQAHLMSNTPGYSVGLYSVDHLKLCSIVGQGRYGSVWKGIVNDQEVAVKIFPSHYRTYFYNERDIYCLPFMDNPALLTYYGCDERNNLEGHMEYLLVLSYAPNGCLQEYLTDNVLDFPTFCKMALTVAKGLAHLHTDIVKGDKIKPCVSHRDLNSRNILVKQDLSCCLCDLGFAMKISGSKYFHNGEEQHAETKSINEVGTRRYMAPEVLEGAVNLRDCETSLKQIDVYSLGLVLWELATRCTDFYQPQVTDLPGYKLPFQQEIGLHPTLEQMQALVSRRKARPLFPVLWRDTAAARLVRDTIEDSWDQDAEARLTALCVEERLSELPLLRDRHYRATMYSNSPTNQTTPGIINNNHLNSNIFHQNHHDNDLMQSANQQSISGKELYDVSEGTVETLLTMSPSEHPTEHTYKNSNQTAHFVSNGLLAQFKQATVSPPLQPYQGRNPCLERNLMLPTDSTDNLQYGSNLIDKSFKHHTHYRSNSNTTESQGLITHDYLGQNGYNSVIGNRPATPIPYVQNVVYDAHSNGNLPKQHNTSTANDPPKTKFRWNGLRKLIDRKLFGRERLEQVPNEEEPKSNLISENVLTRKTTDHVVMDTQVNLVQGKMVNGFGNHNVVTSVLHEDCGGGKRPSTLPLVIVKPKENSSEELNTHKPLIRSESNPTQDKKFSVKPDENTLKCSDSTSGISQIIKRKNSIQKQQSLEHFTEVFSSSSDLSRLKDPNQRIKTPGDVPPSVRRNRGKNLNVARFSLYDDRMMTVDCTHWSSVPDDIDITFEPVLSENGILKPPEVESLKCNRDSVSSF